MSEEKLTPITREEKIISGEDLQPITRMEYFLKMYGGGSGGGGGGSSVLLDKTLTKEGYAADAKAVGDALANVGGGASGGLSIKKITFTDRPTLHAWLQNNYDKVLKTTMNNNQTGALSFDKVVFNDGKLSWSFNSSDIGWVTSGGEVVNMYLTLIKVYIETDTTKLFEYDQSTEQGSIIELPDEYWTAMEVVVTIYYIE